jgi:hypothetical protein
MRDRRCSTLRAALVQRGSTEFPTPGGQTVTRQRSPYLPVAAVQKPADNYLSASMGAATPRVALKQEISTTTDQLKAATTRRIH